MSNVAKFKSKAEQAFEEKIQYAMMHNDWDSVTRIGEQFESYLKLIEPQCSYGNKIIDGEIVCDFHEEADVSGRIDPNRPCAAVAPCAPTPEELQQAMERHPAGRAAALHPTAIPPAPSMDTAITAALANKSASARIASIWNKEK